MLLILGIENFKQNYDGKLTLALGNFDGVHLGHREIIRTTVTTAKKNGTASAVLILSPHPLSVLFPQKPPALLMTMEDRISKLGDEGIDFIIVHPFSREFAAIKPEEFARDILHEKLGADCIVVGFDYSFGHFGSGSPTDLTEFGKRFGFCVNIMEPVRVAGVTAASTIIRGLLQTGRVEEAARMLGYPFYLRGSVVHGDGRGRLLGFPTANVLTPCDVILPDHGVYLTKIHGEGLEAWAVTNVGKRPTFCQGEANVEVHLLDVERNLYDKELIVHFLQKIREERVFSGAGELIEQIELDIALARQLISEQ
ncbi:MAG: bifunctional riboflavin kinase/FAD synthetase [Clostridiales bacterium]|jgi:riboflavin kinase/FMN adenylyltransferase|nr:bifunctional riboflavin kinase/FAD synthetase [Clostridiales bacterium]